MSSGSSYSTLRALRARLLRRQEDEGLRRIADFLAGVPLFAPLTRGMHFELADAIHERSYSREEVLYYEGDPGIGLYVIRRGSVQLSVRDEEDVDQPVRVVSDLDVIGANALFGGGLLRRAETARATTDTEVLGLFSPEFRTLQRRHPKTGAAVATLLARHFALCFTEARTLLAEREGRVAAATHVGDARSRAAARMADMPGL